MYEMIELVNTILLIVIVVPPLISTVVSTSLIVVVPPSLVGIIHPSLVGMVLPTLVVVSALVVIAALLIVSLIRTVIEIMGSCQGVVFLLELRTLISVMSIAGTYSAHSLRNQLLTLLLWGRLMLLLIQLYLLQYVGHLSQSLCESSSLTARGNLRNSLGMVGPMPSILGRFS